MTTYEHYGQALTAENLQVACYQAALGRPRVPMALHPMDGTQWLVELIDAVCGHPLEEELDLTLAELLATTDAGELDVLAAVVESRPGHVPPQAIADTLRRAPTASQSARGALARALSAALLTGSLPYSTGLRDLATDRTARDALAAAYLCLDHAWAMQQSTTWFTGDADEDRQLLLRIASPLGRGELRALAAEVTAPTSLLPPAVAAQIATYVDTVADRPYFADRGDAVRWHAGS